MAESQLVRFDVGGHPFVTTRSTLARHSECRLTAFADGEIDEATQGIVFALPDGSTFIDRDPNLFSILLNYMRMNRLILPDNFKESTRLRDEALFYGLQSLADQLSAAAETMGGYITLGYRGTFAFGRDGQADVKFRKLNRILVHGKAALCKEVFGDSLNESRDPGDHDGNERYTARLYLKHQCLEKACDNMAEKGFKLVSTCTSGANGLASQHHGATSTSQNGNRMSRFKRGLYAGSEEAVTEDFMNHRNSGENEELRWAHYTEYVFFRESGNTTSPLTANCYAQ